MLSAVTYPRRQYLLGFKTLSDSFATLSIDSPNAFYGEKEREHYIMVNSERNKIHIQLTSRLGDLDKSPSIFVEYTTQWW